MELKKQVTSQKVSKRLKELGVKQESYFAWVNGEIWDTTMQSDYETMGTPRREEWLSAFTVSELGAIISPNFAIVGKTPPEISGIHGDEKNFARKLFDPDNWGKILIYLLEKKLIIFIKS